MKIYLAVFLKYNDPSETRRVLMEFNSIKELDNFTKRFNDSNEIKQKYARDIEEFILDYRNTHKYKQKKDGSVFVYLTAYRIVNEQLEFIKLSFRKKTVIKTFSIYEFSEYIKALLLETKKTLYDKRKYISSYDVNDYINILRDFNIELSGFEQELLRYFAYCDMQENEKKLDDFLRELRRSLRKMEPNTIYEKLRFKISDLEKYDSIVERHKLTTTKMYPTINTSFGKIKNINIPRENLSLQKNGIIETCDDERFIKMASDENYDDLYKYYSLEEIERFSENKQSPIGARRK